MQDVKAAVVTPVRRVDGTGWDDRFEGMPNTARMRLGARRPTPG